MPPRLRHPVARLRAQARGSPSLIADIADLSPEEANYKKKVTDYLLKRGFTKTEAVFRQESRNLGPDGKPVHVKAEDLGAKQYTKAFTLLKNWIDKNLDIYKVKFICLTFCDYHV
jgi:transcription initiation factor TFIID subunit 5